MRATRTRVGGFDLAVTEAGERGAAPFVLVHGIGMSARYFRPLVEVLGRDGHVVAPDLPGFGASARPRSVLGIAELAATVAALVEETGLVRPVLIGHSMGCQVVTEVLATRPGLAAGGVLIGPVTDDDARSAPRQAVRLLRDGRHEPLRLNALITADYVRCGPRRYLATLPHMLDYRTEERISQVTDPVVVVRGDRDPIAPAPWVARLAAAAPAGTVAQVAGAGHVAHYTRPDQVSRLCQAVTC